METDGDYVVQSVVSPSGQYTFRVWFGESTYPGIKDQVMQRMESLAVTTEWSSENLLGLSARDADQAQQVADYLHSREGEGHLKYETGRTA